MTYIEVICPKKHEEEYVKILSKLGTEKVLFLYEKEPKTLENLEKTYDIEIFTGLIDTNKPHNIVFKKGNRHNVENRSVPYLYGFESFSNNDHMHYRKSGMNQVIAKLLKERDKYYVIPVENILTSPEPQILLGRIELNLKMARKYGFNVIIAGMNTDPKLLRAKEEYKSLIRSLGYEDLAKEAVHNLDTSLQSLLEE